jgi:hypothetical protein
MYCSERSRRVVIAGASSDARDAWAAVRVVEGVSSKCWQASMVSKGLVDGLEGGREEWRVRIEGLREIECRIWVAGYGLTVEKRNASDMDNMIGRACGIVGWE